MARISSIFQSSLHRFGRLVIRCTHFYVGNWWQSFLRICVLSCQSEKRSYTQCYTSRNGFWTDPEGYPGHDHDETRGYVRMEEVVTQTSSERKDYLQTCKIALKITRTFSILYKNNTLCSGRQIL